MISLPLGFLGMVLIIAFTMGGNASASQYLNAHSMGMVLGGTVAILFFTTPLAGLGRLMKDLRRLFRTEASLPDLRALLQELLRDRNTSAAEGLSPLVDYARGLWQAGVSKELFIPLLAQKKSELDDELVDSIQALKNLAKYPPALGMTGTVIGLITLFSNLNADSKAKLGPALALAMTATFFGLIVANALVVPLADRLQLVQMKRRHTNAKLYKLLLLIHNFEPQVIIEEELKRDAA